MRSFLGVAMLTVSAIGAASNAAGDLIDSNLIVNGDAETPPYGTTIFGWQNASTLETVKYGTSGGFPDYNTPGPTDRGDYFFGGGNSASSEITQSIDISSLSALVDAGLLKYELSGWFGGYYDHRDHAFLTASFKDSVSGLLGAAEIGPVTNLDRANVTEFQFRSGSGQIPSGSRAIDFRLACARLDGTYCDGYADELSFVVANVPEPATTTPLVIGVLGLIFFLRRRKRHA